MNARIEGLFGYLYNQTPPILVSEMQSRSRWSRLRDPLLLIPVLGLLCADLVLASNVLLSITAGDVFALLLGTPLLTLYTLSLLILWWRPRAGYIMSTVVSAVSLFIFVGIGNPLPTLAGPADTTAFLFAISFPPALITVLVYSLLGLRAQRHPPDTGKPAQTIPRYTVASLFILGFVMGGIAVGLMAGATQSRLLANSSSADITIVKDAALPSTAQPYSPATFQAHVGQTVTWVNRDTTAHTVTSKDNLFDSGIMDIGARYEFNFTQAGTFQYYCTLHPKMTAEVIVS